MNYFSLLCSLIVVCLSISLEGSEHQVRKSNEKLTNLPFNKKSKKTKKKKTKEKANKTLPVAQEPQAQNEPPKQKEFVYLYPTPGVGFFGEFLSILGALHLYDTGHYAGVKIDYSKVGTYYDSVRQGDWWEYYFEPVCLGSPDNATPLHTGNGPNEIGGYNRMVEFGVSRADAHKLIKKYIHLKPHMEEKIKTYVKTHFKKNDVIGVHYRGTDKFVNEAPYLPYEDVANQVDELMKKHGKDAQIFIATDEQNFLDYMIARYPSQVIYYEEAARSVDGRPVHYNASYWDPYKRGEEAVMDCLLLSKCDILLKTSSNLSLCSAYFNPKMPMIHLSVRPWHAPLE